MFWAFPPRLSFADRAAPCGPLGPTSWLCCLLHAAVLPLHARFLVSFLSSSKEFHYEAPTTSPLPASSPPLCGMQASLLQYAQGIAEAQSGAPVPDAVVAVPPFFGQAQRQALQDAAQLAGELWPSMSMPASLSAPWTQTYSLNELINSIHQ
eukprot:scaffold103534_cov24-Tisochrysis_lutea.AAC.1